MPLVQHLVTRLRPHRRLLLVALVLVTFVWLLFFDSYSLYDRLIWQRSYDRVREENEHLEAEIRRLERQNATELSDEEVEHIAREQYGMKKPGETVYRLKESEQ